MGIRVFVPLLCFDTTLLFLRWSGPKLWSQKKAKYLAENELFDQQRDRQRESHPTNNRHDCDECLHRVLLYA